MTVDFNHDKVMEMFIKKRKKFLTMTGQQGANIAAENSRVDLGTSRSAKEFSWVHPDKLTTFKNEKDFLPRYGKSGNDDQDTIYINAPMEYDVYLERRWGVMAKTVDMLIPDMEKYERSVFGE